jgi:hypothetical protein
MQVKKLSQHTEILRWEASAEIMHTFLIPLKLQKQERSNMLSGALAEIVY